MIYLIKTMADILWDYLLVYLLIIAGLIFLIVFKGAQFRYFKHMFTLLRKGLKEGPSEKPSMMSALCLSIAGRVGTGNIASVGIAIAIGGPGSIFWMWILAIIGMGTSIFECSLAQLYKKHGDKGSYIGGPAFYIEEGLKKILGRGSKVLARIYAALLLFTFGIAFNGMQSFTLADNLYIAYQWNHYYIAIGICLIFILIIMKGLQSILKTVNLIVPFMAILYLTIAMIIIGINISEVPNLIQLIIKEALGFSSILGAGLGTIFMQGVKRGLFSNEAGLGSVPNAAAISHLKHPVEQGIIQSFSVFVDTILICTATAFIILLSEIDLSSLSSIQRASLAQLAIIEHLGDFGKPIFVIILTLFIFSTIAYNYYLSLNIVKYLSKNNRIAMNLLKISCILCIFWSSVKDLSSILSIADFSMAGLALINLITLLLLIPIGQRLIFDYGRQLKEKRIPSLQVKDYKDLNIDYEVWNNI